MPRWRRLTPHPDLHAQVRTYFIAHHDGAPGGHRLLPDGSVDLVFNLDPIRDDFDAVVIGAPRCGRPPPTPLEPPASTTSWARARPARAPPPARWFESPSSDCAHAMAPSRCGRSVASSAHPSGASSACSRSRSGLHQRPWPESSASRPPSRVPLGVSMRERTSRHRRPGRAVALGALVASAWGTAGARARAHADDTVDGVTDAMARAPSPVERGAGRWGIGMQFGAFDAPKGHLGIPLQPGFIGGGRRPPGASGPRSLRERRAHPGLRRTGLIRPTRRHLRRIRVRVRRTAGVWPASPGGRPRPVAARRVRHLRRAGPARDAHTIDRAPVRAGGRLPRAPLNRTPGHHQTCSGPRRRCGGPCVWRAAVVGRRREA